MSSPFVTLRVDNFIAYVGLAKEPVNAVDRSMRYQMIEIFDKLSERRDVRVVVIESGTKVFCAGVDLKDRPDPDSAGDLTSTNRLTRETFNSIRECNKPVICKVQGGAMGLGVVLALSCDIIVASEDAWFSMPEINVGLAGGVAALQSFLPRSLARKLIYTGARIDAKELGAYGVIDCVAHAQLDDFVHNLATEISEKSPPAIRYAKRSANLAELMHPAEAYKFEQHYTSQLASSADGIEARKAMLEKRKPVFNEN